VATASLGGRVLGIPQGKEDEVRVLAIGASAMVRAVRVGTDGSYRIESLDPGEYMLRAFLGTGADALGDQMGAVFAAGVGALRRDVALAEGEHAVLDIRLEVPPAGTVKGTVTINGAPAGGCRAEIYSATIGRSLTSAPDARGEFTIANVPPGGYTFRVTVSVSGNRQEMHREAIEVLARGVVQVQVDLRVGGLSGQVVAEDGTPADQLEGTIWVLPGATATPPDVREYSRGNRVHEVRVRNGVFRADMLTAGPARLVVQVRGRQAGEAAVEIPAGGVKDLALPAGGVAR
jgi:hypothetical protein